MRNETYVIRTFEHAGLKINVVNDDSPESPREWDNLGRMFCWHRRYKLGDVQPKEEPVDWLLGVLSDYDYDTAERINEDEKLKTHERIEQAIAALEQHLVILPLYLMDHSGISMSTGAYGCRWDSGQVGWVVATHSEIAERFGVEGKPAEITPELLKRAREAIEHEVKTYSTYLEGGVMGYQIVNPANDEVLHSCYGFYEDEDLEYEAKNAAEYERAQLNKKETNAKRYRDAAWKLLHPVNLPAKIDGDAEVDFDGANGGCWVTVKLFVSADKAKE